jgi:hypothetical protein
LDNPKTLLSHVAGLLKYALQNKQGMVSASEFAALTGQTEAIIHTCFKWFSSNSELKMNAAASEDIYQIESNPTQTPAKNGIYAERLKLQMAEAQAYRQYWLTQNF